MIKRKLTIRFSILLLCSLVLSGCDRSAKERDKATAEAEKAKAELVRIKFELEQTQGERDELQKTIDEISENLENTKSKLAIMMQTKEELQNQADELTNEQDTYASEAKDCEAMVKKLIEQLQEKTKEIREYEERGAELQVTIEDLEGQVPDVEFVPTPQDVVDKMLELAKVKEDDLVYDLGCGDGRIVVTAAKKYGCKAVGFDIDPQRVKESLENVEKNNVVHLVRIEQKDIFTLDLSKASVITLYLLPELNVELIPQLEKLKPGSRIVSHDFEMEGVRPDKVVKLISNEDDEEHEIYLWTSPLKKITERKTEKLGTATYLGKLWTLFF